MSRPANFPLWKAFACAGRGVFLLSHGRNGRVQMVTAIIAVMLGTILRLTAIEWVAITFAIFTVLALEAMNSAIEHVVDLASPHYTEFARSAKDLAAGAVLIASVGSLIVGAIVFVPRIIAL